MKHVVYKAESSHEVIFFDEQWLFYFDSKPAVVDIIKAIEESGPDADPTDKVAAIEGVRKGKYVIRQLEIREVMKQHGP